MSTHADSGSSAVALSRHRVAAAPDPILGRPAAARLRTERKRPRAERIWRRLWPYVAVVLIVALGLAVAEALLLGLQLSRVSVVLLAAVVIAGIRYGARPAIFAAVASFVAQNIFLLQPIMKARMSTREQALTLIIFLLVALLTGNLAGRMRDAARRALALSDANSRLFDASRRMSTTDDEGVLRAVLLERVQDLTGAAARLAPPEEAELSVSDDFMLQSHALTAQNETLGVLIWRRVDAAESNTIDGTVRVLADLCAASIARVRLAENRRELEVAAQSERLQTALLSSISHDFRTPLSAILTSASSLVAYGDRFTPETRMDLAANIQEEAERLNRYVANLLNMTKLDAGGVHAERTAFEPSEVIHRVVRSAQRAHPTKSVEVEVETGAMALGDPVLFEPALQNVVENAFRFARTRVHVASSVEAGQIVTRVHDDGPGVPESEMALIFDRFFCSSGQPAPGPKGAGLGLSITRGFLEAMGGRADAGAGPRGHGLEVRLNLPAVAP